MTTFLESNDVEIMLTRRFQLASMIEENEEHIDKLIQGGHSTIPLRIVEDRLVMEDQLLKIAIIKLGVGL